MVVLQVMHLRRRDLQIELDRNIPSNMVPVFLLFPLLFCVIIIDILKYVKLVIIVWDLNGGNLWHRWKHEVEMGVYLWEDSGSVNNKSHSEMSQGRLMKLRKHTCGIKGNVKCIR